MENHSQPNDTLVVVKQYNDEHGHHNDLDVAKKVLR